jgi:hypothetical protein
MHFFLLRFRCFRFSLVETFSFRGTPPCYRVTVKIEAPFEASEYGDSHG